MPRVVKVVEYAMRRDAFLDAAQRLVQSKGYERMTVQDVLDEVQTSKGAFYHYFDSKAALLEALIDRLSRQTQALLEPIARSPTGTALEKLQRLFAALAGWKTGRKELLLALLGTWYADENALVRQKTRAAVTARIAPLLAAIIAQGVHEGALHTAHADTVAALVVALIHELNDALGRLMLAHEPGRDTLAVARRTLAVYSDAIERLLGAPSGALPLLDADTLDAWLGSQEDTR